MSTAAGLSLIQLVAAQAPAPGAPASPQDIAILVGIGVFFLGFAVLGFMALRKKRQERLNILTEASKEADREHGLDDYVDGKKLPPKQEDDIVPDQAVPAGSDSDRAKAEMDPFLDEFARGHSGEHACSSQSRASPSSCGASTSRTRA